MNLQRLIVWMVHIRFVNFIFVEMSKEPFVISQTYDLLKETSTASNWEGNQIRITRPYGLSNVSAVKFREFKGEMLPFTQMDLPELKCEVTAKVRKMATAEIVGDMNEYTQEEITAGGTNEGKVFEFSKAWTYDSNAESQIIHNVSECIQMANQRMQTIYPLIETTYLYGGGQFDNMIDQTIHLSRANLGSGAIGFTLEHHKTLNVYNGTPTPLDIAFQVEGSFNPSLTTYMRQCYTNYNNSLFYLDGTTNVNNVESTSYESIYFNPSTTEEGTAEIYTGGGNSNYMPGDYLCYHFDENKRLKGSVFATIEIDEDQSKRNAMMIAYNVLNDGALYFRGITLFIANPSASGKRNRILVDWNTFITTETMGGNYQIAHILAFNTKWDSVSEVLILYMLVVAMKTRATSPPTETNNYRYVLCGCPIYLANNTSGPVTLIDFVDSTDWDGFNNSLAMLYQYGADVGEMSIATVDSDTFYNFGYKYVVKANENNQGHMEHKELISSIWDVNADGNGFKYMVKIKNQEKQGIVEIGDVAANDLFEDEGVTVGTSLSNLHIYHLLCARGNDLSDPYSFEVKARLRNVSLESFTINRDVLSNLDAYYLGSLHEDDTTQNIIKSQYVNMHLDTTSPSSSLVYPVVVDGVEYATAEDSFNGYYFDNISIVDNAMTGNITRPTVILYNSTDSVYYQIIYSLHVYTHPYYFEFYTNLNDITSPGSKLHSLIIQTVPIIYNQLNTKVLNTLEALIVMRYEFNDLILRCSTFPNIDNVVFSINETSRVRMKTMGVDSTVTSLILSIEDREGNRIDRETLKALYGMLNVSIDWEQ